MSDFGNILWESGEQDTWPRLSCSKKSFDSFLSYCETKIPKLSNSYKAVEKQKKLLEDVYKDSIEKIIKEPFLASFVVWLKEAGHVTAVLLEGAKILLENGFIGTMDSQGKIWTIQKAKGFDQRKILEAIRCRHDWPIATREGLVKIYINFIQWLHNITYGYISTLEDPDYQLSIGRALPYLQFIQFLEALPNEKSQLVAKLLYFGGNRTLEVVLSLDLKQVDFKKRLIQFESDSVSYPEHIFSDINALTIKDRSCI